MSSVGLLYVGAVLCVNGLVLIGLVRPRGATVLNFLVGALQVVFPTILLSGAGGDPDAILAASGLYLFGFTYLWVGAINTFDLPAEGFGWFSLYVAIAAVVFGGAAVVLQADPVSAAMWWLWAALWFLFFLLDGFGHTWLRVPIGWFAIFCGIATCTLPALLQLLGLYAPSPVAGAALGLVGTAVLVLALTLGRRSLRPRRIETDAELTGDPEAAVARPAASAPAPAEGQSDAESGAARPSDGVSEPGPTEIAARIVTRR
ncbi:AmiS/UreI family transporter [Zhihengliuella sp.]|uniref:AmiS/UreI family transporter n=1 Tax=Zhihengliuella sp. TaxID=1954483 RepID=UPI002811C213|nr:AmiS/UreI family transporter [Zhihengliuella sp.]